MNASTARSLSRSRICSYRAFASAISCRVSAICPWIWASSASARSTAWTAALSWTWIAAIWA
jgi:hypothetical protein